MGSVPGTAQMDGRKVLREAPTPGPTRGTRVEGDKSRVFSSLVVCSGTDSCGRGSRGRSLLEAFAGWSAKSGGLRSAVWCKYVRGWSRGIGLDAKEEEDRRREERRRPEGASSRPAARVGLAAKGTKA